LTFATETFPLLKTCVVFIAQMAMKLLDVSAINVSEKKEVRPDLLVSTVTFDGLEVIQLGVPTPISGTKDVRFNEQYKIFSIRVRLTEDLATKIKEEGSKLNIPFSHPNNMQKGK
jgi:hypothetical protein